MAGPQWVAIVEGAREKLNADSTGSKVLQAHPRIVGQILDSGSWTDSDEIQDLWAGLLASSCTGDGKDESNLIFTTLLGQLTSLEVRVLTYACETATKNVSPAGWLHAEDVIINLAELMQITGVSDVHRLDRELDHLRALELIKQGFDQDTRDADITPTSLALQLYARCKGHPGDPLRFFGLTDPPEDAGAAQGITAKSDKVGGRARKSSTPKKPASQQRKA